MRIERFYIFMLVIMSALGYIADAKEYNSCGYSEDEVTNKQYEEDSDVSAFDYQSLFTINEIDDEVFGRIKGKSYKDNCTVPLSQLRYLTVGYRTIDGNTSKGEIICNKDIATDLIEIFKNLYEADYPIESIRLIDEFDADDIKSMQANNTSCFNFRQIAGSKKLSKHALGLAIDVNPLYNPYVKMKTDGTLIVSPEEGRPYADRNSEIPYKIDENDLLYKEFVKHGFEWGGSWTSLKDYQHFEK